MKSREVQVSTVNNPTTSPQRKKQKNCLQIHKLFFSSSNHTLQKNNRQTVNI